MLSKNDKKVLTDPLISNNPIAMQVLGICSALAVTTQVKPAFVMCVSVTLVVCVANFLISVLRNGIPSRIRIIVELCVVASLVILVDQVLKAYMFDLSKQLSVFVGLIITNCIVMGRLEAFALMNKPFPSVLDGLGNGLGYSLVLMLVACMREVLGAGKIAGIPVIPQALFDAGYVNNGLMVLAPGAFILLGLYIWAQNSLFPPKAGK
ncbi:MAG: NADH:ubiquinone reductase (Na(+)-transporting) subunit D [Candidatus Cloacimonetes bacterium]|nr:NADH:ubiquinone reductase (Na(+)-transporting) subunit D [Candidatus Cloacimonadota bacterium]